MREPACACTAPRPAHACSAHCSGMHTAGRTHRPRTQGKAAARKELRNRLKLAHVDVPIVGCVTRLVAQKVWCVHVHVCACVCACVGGWGQVDRREGEDEDAGGRGGRVYRSEASAHQARVPSLARPVLHIPRRSSLHCRAPRRACTSLSTRHGARWSGAASLCSWGLRLMGGCR